MTEVIRCAMLAGMQDGVSHNRGEVKEALRVLGLGDLAFMDHAEGK